MAINQKTLDAIKKMPKQMTPETGKDQRGSKQWNFKIEFDMDALPKQESGAQLKLSFFARQNKNDDTNFSCGILLASERKKPFALSRYNGSNHENKVANYQCHIHHSTLESINDGSRKPEHANTQVTTRYDTLSGAVNCLVEDYNIKVASPPQLNLPLGEGGLTHWLQ